MDMTCSEANKGKKYTIVFISAGELYRKTKASITVVESKNPPKT